MKKHMLFFTILVVLVTFLNVHAQNNRIGIIGGINIANLDEEDVSYDSRTGFGIGGILEFEVQDKFSICFEPMYLQKGASEDTINISMDINLAYVEIPVFFKFPIGTGAVRPYIMAGPTLGILMSAEMEINAMGFSIGVDFEDLVESIDYGLGVGGGVNFPVGTNQFFIEARYTLGLADIVKEGEVDMQGEKLTIPDAEVKNRGFQIMAGISIPLGMR